MGDPLNQIDLHLTRRRADSLTSDREVVDIDVNSSGDVRTTTGVGNLIQAVINRLLTRKGELAQLGHPEYGSRLYQLVGEINDTRVRALAEIYIRESLAQEARVEEVRYITFAPPSRGPAYDVLQITVAVKPVGLPDLVSLTMALSLGG